MQNEQILTKMDEDMTFRAYTSSTKANYAGKIKIFMKYLKKPVEEVTEEDIRNFLKYLMYDKKLKNRSVNIYNSAIRFLYGVTLNKILNFKQMPLFRIKRELPELLTKEELQKVFDTCKNIKHKAMLMTMYGGGLRVTETVRLRVQDIDSKEMRIFVKNGKHGRDRYTILSEENLKILREYYLEYKPKHSKGYLFLSGDSKEHLNRNTIERTFTKICKKKCNINKKVTVHTLRHCFATHLYESGTELVNIQELLGHASLRSTVDYLHLANMNKGIISPLDALNTAGDVNG